MNPEFKVLVKYYKLEVDGKTFNFNHAGHCEQVLRGLVHSGYQVTISEVVEERKVTQDEINRYRAEDINWRYVNEEELRPRIANAVASREESYAASTACR